MFQIAVERLKHSASRVSTFYTVRNFRAVLKEKPKPDDTNI